MPVVTSKKAPGIEKSNTLQVYQGRTPRKIRMSTVKTNKLCIVDKEEPTLRWEIDFSDADICNMSISYEPMYSEAEDIIYDFYFYNNKF